MPNVVLLPKAKSVYNNCRFEIFANFDSNPSKPIFSFGGNNYTEFFSYALANKYI